MTYSQTAGERDTSNAVLMTDRHNEQLSFSAFQRYLQALLAILQVLLYHRGPEEPNKGVASAAHCYSHGEDGVSACGRQYRVGAYRSRAIAECDDPGWLVFDDLYLALLDAAMQCTDLLEDCIQA